MLLLLLLLEESVGIVVVGHVVGDVSVVGVLSSVPKRIIN